MVEENFNEHESGDTDARFFALRAATAHQQQSSRCGQYSVLRKWLCRGRKLCQHRPRRSFSGCWCPLLESLLPNRGLAPVTPRWSNDPTPPLSDSMNSREVTIFHKVETNQTRGRTYEYKSQSRRLVRDLCPGYGASQGLLPKDI